MPTPAYMKVEGSNQGLITAGANTADSMANKYQEGVEDYSTVQALKHEVILPRDPQSGQPSGQRVHQPLVITKIMDKASPLLSNSLSTGENLTEVELKFYRTSMTGTEEHYFTIKLTDARIVDMRTYFPNAQDPATAHFTHLEDVEFSYRMIEWTHEVAGTSASDDWRARDYT